MYFRRSFKIAGGKGDITWVLWNSTAQLRDGLRTRYLKLVVKARIEAVRRPVAEADNRSSTKCLMKKECLQPDLKDFKSFFLK